MTTQQAIGLLVAIITSAAMGSLVTGIVTWRLGIKGDERVARRDEVEDREWLVDHWRSIATEALAKLATRDAQLLAEREYAESLRHDIYTSKPPPPRDRPT